MLKSVNDIKKRDYDHNNTKYRIITIYGSIEFNRINIKFVQLILEDELRQSL